jgi:hypothetical protein
MLARDTAPHLHAAVTLATPDGSLHVLSHGDVIGRVWSAALCLEDPKVSEAHAMVSLRGSRLRLLALRGLFAVDGVPRKELDLTPGQRVHLTRSLALDVVAVTLPDRVLALRIPGQGEQPLSGVCSLVEQPTLAVRPGAHTDARAVFFLSGDRWVVQVDGRTEPVEDGWGLVLDGGVVEAQWKHLSAAGVATVAEGRLLSPLQIVCRYDSVMLHRAGMPPMRLTGHAARMLSELGAVGAPLHWEALARELWTDPELDPHFLRKRFDAVLGRLRRKLRDAGIRADLVRSDRSGLFELVLRPEDVLRDES